MKRLGLILLGVLATAFLVAGCRSSSELSSEAPTVYVFTAPEIVIDPSWPEAPLEEVTSLDFYAVNDFHGALEYNPYSNELGINRMATYFSDRKEENADGTVILSIGDMWQGSADSNITRGRLTVDAMNLIGFEAMAIGNHEFDWGVETIAQNQIQADFPFLSANIFEKATGTNAEFALPYTMIDRGGVRIGLIGTIGATLESIILTSNVLPYDFTSSASLVRQSAANLREAGADVVVLLNHNGEIESGILSDVDIAFNAHTHETYSRLTSGTPVIQSGYNGRAVGHVSLTYTASTGSLEVAEYGVDTELIDLGLTEDPDMKAIYDQYLEEEINAVKNEVLGEATGYFSKAKLGDLAVKSMLDYGAQFGAQVAFHNAGGVRATISQGTVTYGDIYKVFPFDNELIVAEVTGAELKWWLAQDDYVAGANPFTNTLDGGAAIKDQSIYKIIAINYLTEKHLKEADQYPHDEDTALNTFSYVREVIKDVWQEAETLSPDDYLG
ncbi:MAG: 5'-nucleotidase C-terminal domain-containing protein [Bacilli bacterium]|jgi:2',3'-cyclic-nucleotide 2'-phosphodiesterase/3'-nucleotidase